MSVSQPKTSAKPWSNAKRIKVAGIGTFAILVVAVIIGSFLYHQARKNGVVESQSLKALVANQLQTDSQFAHVLNQQSNSWQCHNTYLNLSLSVSNLLIPGHTEKQLACMEFKEVKNPESINPAVTIELKAVAKAELLQLVLQSLTNVTTDTFDHPQYPAIKISAFHDGIPVNYYIFQKNEANSILVRYFPANKKTLPALESTLKTLHNESK